jgi:dolichol-phosphate mannosyltransferase
MSNSSESLTIIIPARNEELTLIKTLDRLMKQVIVPTRYIVVSDQSTDKTVSNVKRYILKHKNVELIETSAKQTGFANALKLGFKKAKTAYVLPVMADLCDDPQTINKLYKKIIEGYDIVAGSRYMSGGQKLGGPWMQGLLSKLVCLSIQKITSIPTHDSSNSFKMYRRTILNRLIIDSGLGFEVSMSLTLQAYFAGLRITELPTTWRGRTEGKSKFKFLQRFPRYVSIYMWAIKERTKQLVSHSV